MQTQKRLFTDLADTRGGFEASDPIFILGMPRAGSTLLEQILSSHSQVDGTQELPNILSIVHQLRSQFNKFDRLNYPRAIKDLNASALFEFGKAYIDGTQSYRGSSPFFIDKMPNNFRHIGLIKLILPNAKIIDARRHPLSCTFSCFKQLFAEGQEFSYSLSDLGTYYKDYVKLMDFWHECFPGDILHVQYEDVVDDLVPLWIGFSLAHLSCSGFEIKYSDQFSGMSCLFPKWFVFVIVYVFVFVNFFGHFMSSHHSEEMSQR